VRYRGGVSAAASRNRLCRVALPLHGEIMDDRARHCWPVWLAFAHTAALAHDDDRRQRAAAAGVLPK